MVYMIMQVRGAARVILIDNVADRLSLAQSKIPGLEIIDFNKVWQLADTLESTVSAGIAQYRHFVAVEPPMFPALQLLGMYCNNAPHQGKL